MASQSNVGSIGGGVDSKSRVRRYLKVAGGLVGGLVLIDLIASALTIWFGAGLLRP